MADYEWEPFLRNVSAAILQRGDEEQIESLQGRGIYESAIANRWLGCEPADPPAIAELENRIGVPLPPDYRAFLLVSDGWNFCFWEDELGQRIDYPFGICDLQSASEVDWFAKLDRQIGRLEVYTAGLDDEELVWDQAPAGHLRKALLIGESDGNECILLNPAVVNERGEWETMTFMSDGGDIDRLPSFWDFMHEYAWPLNEN